MAKKPSKRPGPSKAGQIAAKLGAKLQEDCKKLRAENKALRADVKKAAGLVNELTQELAAETARRQELEQRPTLGEVYSGKDAGTAQALATADKIDAPEHIVTVAVGPVMPWETSLPNSFKVA